VKASRFVLDGEIVIPKGSTTSFDDLLQRIHPAESRVQKLSAATPAWLVVFDFLAHGDDSLVERPLRERREELEKFARKQFPRGGRIRLSPATTQLKEARVWFGEAGTSLDGLIAKRLDAPYPSGERTGMVKIKPRRTADCVVGGFRYAEAKRVVGSLLLGL
jgi:ATP-dependent DNA ligase